MRWGEAQGRWRAGLANHGPFPGRPPGPAISQFSDPEGMPGTKLGSTFSDMNAAMSAEVICPEAKALWAVIMSSLDELNSRAMSSGSRKFRWDRRARRGWA